MQLFVRTLTGRTQAVEAAPQERLAAVKERVEAHVLGAPATLVRLVCGGRQLDDALTLAELRVGAGATLHAAARLLGGAPTHVKLISQRCREPSVVVRLSCFRSDAPRSIPQLSAACARVCPRADRDGGGRQLQRREAAPAACDGRARRGPEAATGRLQPDGDD